MRNVRKVCSLLLSMALMVATLGCVSAVGGSVQPVQRLEAETSGTVTGQAKVVSDYNSASGRGIVGYIDDPDSTVTFRLLAPVDGNYRIQLCTSSGTDCTAASFSYYVNGDSANAQTVAFLPYGWDTWTLYNVTVSLTQGENTFTVAHTGQPLSYSQLDYINFYGCPLPDMQLALGGQPLENFSLTQTEYDIQVTGTDLPKVGYVTTGDLSAYDVQIQQPTKVNTDGSVTFILQSHPELSVSYVMHYYDSTAFRSQVVNTGADPFVTYRNGFYYYMNTDGGAFYVCKSDSLATLNSDPVLVYTPGEGEPGDGIWAPELHYIQGEWYIYYTAYFAGQANEQHRTYVLKGTSQDPQDPFTFQGKLSDGTDKWSIDTTVLQLNGELYAIWSGWAGDTDGRQDLYIAHMDSPTHIDSQRVLLSTPTLEYETKSTSPYVNEGPEILYGPNDSVTLVFSVNHYLSQYYALATLTLASGADPLDPACWIKSEAPVFQGLGEQGITSVGHCSFAPSPDGTETYMIYHGREGMTASSPREVFVQKISLQKDGTLEFGSPVGADTLVKLPSGTNSIPMVTYEAENASVTGGAQAQYADFPYYSGGGVVKFLEEGVSGEDAAITFTVWAPSDGTYQLAISASADQPGTGLSLTVNHSASDLLPVVNRNAGGVDTFFWYTRTVPLQAGENTIRLEKSSQYACAAQVDCVRVASMSMEEFAEQAILGDMNQDGSLSVADVVLLRKAILSASDAAVGDMNQDGILSVGDVVLLRKTILNAVN